MSGKIIENLKQRVITELLTANGLSGHGPQIDNALAEIVQENEIDEVVFDTETQETGPGMWILTALRSIIRSAIPVEIMGLFYNGGNAWLTVKMVRDDLRGNKVIAWLADKETILRNADPRWVLKNHETVERFMSENYEPYERLARLTNSINTKFYILQND